MRSLPRRLAGLLLVLSGAAITPATGAEPAGRLLHTFLNPTPAAGDQFGWSVAISGDKVLIGAQFDDAGARESGAAYLFSPVPTSPRQTAPSK